MKIYSNYLCEISNSIQQRSGGTDHWGCKLQRRINCGASKERGEIEDLYDDNEEGENESEFDDVGEEAVAD